MTIFKVRAATPDDMPAIMELLTGMFQDLGTTLIPADWGGDLQRVLSHRLAKDAGAFVVVDERDKPVSVAVGVVDSRLPSPRRPSGEIGYIEWLATEPGWRRRGAARLATEALLRWFDDRGILAVDVHARAGASAVYKSLGFGCAPREGCGDARCSPATRPVGRTP